MTVRSIFPLLKLALASAALLVLIDLCLFRSGIYFRAIEPNSTSGSVVNMAIAIDHYYEPTRKNILVLGNSKIGEGFSGVIADASAARSDLHFVNGSVAGTTPRVWSYLLRKVDPDARRFSAIAMMVDYDVATQRQNLANYPLDSSYNVSLVGLGDLVDYPASFNDPVQASRARRSILFPLQALHDDARNLLEHPLHRFREVTSGRAGWLGAVGQYPGRDSALPDLRIDPNTHMPTDWGGHESELKPYFAALDQGAEPSLQATNCEYMSKWIGGIAKRYGEHHIPVIVFVVPRGPWHRDLAARPVLNGAIAGMVHDGALIALPGDAFVDLEQPQYFFDTLHLNRSGRQIFSRLFAERVAPLIPE